MYIDYTACNKIIININFSGKVSNFTVDSSSLHPGYRSALTLITCAATVVTWTDFSPEVFDRGQEQMEPKMSAFAARLRKFGNGESLNDGDSDNPNWEQDFWGSNYFRLYKIKRKYDPTNFFTCHHCVGSYSAREETSAGGVLHSDGASFAILVLMALVNLFLNFVKT